ncbi:MAG: NAD(P)H-dependent oxidoreductase [Ginsengibacter sp.]
METLKKIFIIVGSASKNSANEKLAEILHVSLSEKFNVEIFSDLKVLPHFDPELSIQDPPQIITQFRKTIEKADGIIICTPEYVFSIPSGLKNAIEWCIATTVFSDKPLGIITASASGKMGHKELKLIMKTVMANFTEETTLLIQGMKGKIGESGEIKDDKTKNDLQNFILAFETLIYPLTKID